jgi:hypothetical protein
MKRIILGVLTAGTAALLLIGRAAHAEEGAYAPPAVQQAQWRGGDEGGYSDRGGWRAREHRRELRARYEARRERERRERERFEHQRGEWDRW